MIGRRPAGREAGAAVRGSAGASGPGPVSSPWRSRRGRSGGPGWAPPTEPSSGLPAPTRRCRGRRPAPTPARPAGWCGEPGCLSGRCGRPGAASSPRPPAPAGGDCRCRGDAARCRPRTYRPAGWPGLAASCSPGRGGVRPDRQRTRPGRDGTGAGSGPPAGRPSAGPGRPRGAAAAEWSARRHHAAGPMPRAGRAGHRRRSGGPSRGSRGDRLRSARQDHGRYAASSSAGSPRRRPAARRCARSCARPARCARTSPG